MGGFSGLPNGFVPGGTASLADIITGMGREKGVAEEAQARPAQLQAETAQQQAVTEQERLKTAIMQRDLHDQGIMRQVIAANPDGDPEKIRKGLIQAGISAPGYTGFQSHIADMRQKLATAQKDEVSNELVSHQRVGDILAAIDQAPAEQQPSLIQQSLPELQKIEPGNRWDPNQLADPAERKYLLGTHGMASKLLEQGKVKQDIATSTAQQGKAEADTAEAQVKTKTAQRDQAVADLGALDPADTQGWQKWAQAHPELRPPASYRPDYVQRLTRSEVKPSEQPAYDIQNRQAAAIAALTPEKIGQRADAVIDPQKYPDENQRLRAMIQGAIEAGAKPETIDALYKDSADRIGRLEAGVAQAKATQPIKIETALATERAKQGINELSPEAVEMGADLYRKTGQMPSLARNRTAVKQIMDRAAAMGPIDLATEQAAYSANKSSLVGLQKNLDSVTAFENTAKKNLDLFLEQAKKVVDTGSPWINSPLRSIQKNGLGSADQAAYETARQVAINEIAKVTGNPGLNGQLSDSARKEVAEFNPNSATLAQTYRVAQVLKQDMENRRQSYQEQIEDISKRIGHKSPAAGGETKATHRFNPATGKIEPIQ